MGGSQIRTTGIAVGVGARMKAQHPNTCRYGENEKVRDFGVAYGPPTPRDRSA